LQRSIAGLILRYVEKVYVATYTITPPSLRCHDLQDYHFYGCTEYVSVECLRGVAEMMGCGMNFSQREAAGMLFMRSLA